MPVRKGDVPPRVLRVPLLAQLVPAIAAFDVLLIGAIVLLVAVAASLQPAWKAARMDPITALRHV